VEVEPVEWSPPVDKSKRVDYYMPFPPVDKSTGYGATPDKSG
jgi:hypothetical protein